MPYFSDFFARRRLLARWVGWFFLSNALLYYVIGLRYLSVLFASDTLYKTTTGDLTGVFGKIVVITFALVSYIGQLGLLAFLPAVLVFIVLLLIPAKRFCIFFAIVLASCATVLLLTDSMVFNQYRFHLSVPILQLIFSTDFTDVFDFSKIELLGIGSIITGIIVVQLLLAFVVERLIIRKNYLQCGKEIAVTISTCLIISYSLFIFSVNAGSNVLSQQIPNWPLYTDTLSIVLPFDGTLSKIEQISENRFSQPLFTLKPLHYPLAPMQCQPQKKPLNILMIAIDSWRADAMNARITPNINSFAEQSLQFTDHFSGGNATKAGLLSLFYAIPSSYWSSLQQQQQGPVFFQQLLQQNYQLGVFWASEMANPALDTTVFHDVKPLRTAHAPGATVGDWDRYITNEFQQFLTQRNKQKPFFAFLFYDAVHGYCRKQNFSKPFQPAINDCFRIGLTAKTDPVPYINRYNNAVHFDDQQIAKVLAQLRQQHLLDNTIVILTSDHGQQFNENRLNYWGHSSNFTRYQTQVPFVVYWPGKKPEKIDYLTSHYDVVPTLMQNALGCTTDFKNYSIGAGLFNSAKRPFVIFGSNMYMGYSDDKQIVTLLTSGNITIDDPRGLPANNAKLNATILRQVLAEMRKFYQV